MFLIVVVLTKTNIYNIMFASLFASSLTFIRESLFIIHFSLSLSLLKNLRDPCNFEKFSFRIAILLLLVVFNAHTTECLNYNCFINGHG
jgi:hypothetical protein